VVQLSACTPLSPLDGFLPFIGNTESGLRNPWLLAWHLTEVQEPPLKVAAESRADLYLAHVAYVSSREKYELKKEIMPDSICGMGLARLARVGFLGSGHSYKLRTTTQPPFLGDRL